MPQVAIDLPDLLTAIVTQVQSTTALDASLVYLTLDESDEPKIKKSVQQIAIAPTAFAVDVGQQTGGAIYQAQGSGGVGPGTYVFIGSVVVSCWVNYQVDQVGQVPLWISNAARGAFPLFKKVMIALEQWQPVDGGNNNMTEQPLRIAPPGFQFVPGSETSMRRIRSEWSFSYRQKLS